MHTEVVNPSLEVRHVHRHLGFRPDELEEVLCDQRADHFELLRKRQNVRTDGGEVLLHGLPRDLDDVLTQPNASVRQVVFGLVNAFHG